MAYKVGMSTYIDAWNRLTDIPARKKQVAWMQRSGIRGVLAGEAVKELSKLI